MSDVKQQILSRLQTIRDPERGGDIVAQDRVAHIAYCDGFATVKLRAEDPAVKQQLHQLVSNALSEFEPVNQLAIEFVTSVSPATSPRPAASTKPLNQPAGQNPAGAPPSPQAAARQNNPLPGVRHVIAVGAGKGGVGKSTVAVNLAVGLARRGLRVGLLDGDIYGPSAPTLLGLGDKQVAGSGQTLYPFEVHGIRAMTIGKLVDPDKPLIWRGPMAHGAFQQLTTQTEWGDLDYLIIDLPPGTGDVPLTMSQILPLTGAIIVCTPQRVAQDDAVRAVGMFRQLQIEVLGVVENMSYFIGDDGREYDIFGKGGAAKMAEQLELPLLGQIPINTALRANSDTGNPSANFTNDDALAAELNAMVKRVVEQIDARADESGPTLTIR